MAFITNSTILIIIVTVFVITGWFVINTYLLKVLFHAIVFVLLLLLLSLLLLLLIFDELEFLVIVLGLLLELLHLILGILGIPHFLLYYILLFNFFGYFFSRSVFHTTHSELFIRGIMNIMGIVELKVLLLLWHRFLIPKSWHAIFIVLELSVKDNSFWFILDLAQFFSVMLR